MAEPELVADCVKAMKDNLDIPISVKCRIGYDHNDSYEELYNFVDKQVQAGVDYVCIHARKGWLSGLSPKENRTIPELKYDVVYNIKKDFPNLELGINGGITTLDLKKLNNILNLFNGLTNAKIYRRYLSENATKKEANVDTFLKALEVFKNKI